jgi:hypothetical protein
MWLSKGNNTLHLIIETCFLGHYLLTHLKGKGNRHILIDLFSKFPTQMHKKKVEQQ